MFRMLCCVCGFASQLCLSVLDGVIGVLDCSQRSETAEEAAEEALATDRLGSGAERT
jgi:hypothetical protein